MSGHEGDKRRPDAARPAAGDSGERGAASRPDVARQAAGGGTHLAGAGLIVATDGPARPELERELLDVARAAARAAARELLARYDAAPEGVATKSSATDPVSEADRASERAIRALLAERRPADAVLGEEGGETTGGDSGIRWVVDPLDGTVNYLYRYPQWSVSIACEDSDGTLVGVVLDPLRDEEVAATRSGPLLLDGEPVLEASGPDGRARTATPDREPVSQGVAPGGRLGMAALDRESPSPRGVAGARERARTLDVALVATGFAYDPAVRARQAAIVPRLLPRVRDVRRGGSAAIDLAWTALGRCDAYFERGLQRWDVAAGALACARAGLELHELPPRYGEPPGLLAAPPELAAELLGIVLG